MNYAGQRKVLANQTQLQTEAQVILIYVTLTRVINISLIILR